MAMEYVIQQDTVDRLNSLHDEIHALSQGRYSDMVDARVAAASMAATLQRILEGDIRPLSPGDDYDDDGWILEEYPDEGKPIEQWSIELPPDLQLSAELITRISPSWYCKKNGTRYMPSGPAMQTAKNLLLGNECSSVDYANFMRSAELGSYEVGPVEHCYVCYTRMNCICEEAWSMNGDTIQFHLEGWLDKDRQWQRHGLATIGEIQSARHPMFVCECPWDKCPAREAAGYEGWKNEFLAGF